ncbi:hypothetical protein AM586_17605 [Massilia sp. WG5]|nr:hypothetical protein AM586_17605 [Massilia sp. WG5]
MLFSILFMQLAVSAYACPAFNLGHDDQLTSSMQAKPADMSSCHDVDMEQPSLCHASHQTDKQSLDKPATPPLSPFVAVGYGLPISLITLTYQRPLGSPIPAFLTYATAPPIAIRNCCFRI